jgi:hypothetical protein
VPSIIRRFTSAPASDIVVVPRDKLDEAVKARASRVHAFVSLPVYPDARTAFIYVGYFCGGLCGEGNYLLLRKGPEGWKVEKSAMLWIS